jgi:protein O-GlcNAc transferase
MREAPQLVLCRAFVCVVIAVLASTPMPARAQASLPPLPQIALDELPGAARADVSRAFENARTRSTDPQAVGALARVLHAWEQWDTAHEAYARAQALAPGEFEWHYLDAILLQRVVRHVEAAERLKAAVALSPEYAPARVKLAESLFESRDVKGASRLFEELARQPATEPMGIFGLGRIAAAEGRHDAAIAHFQRAIELFPEWGSAYYALALSYRALGRRQDATQALQRHAQYGTRWPALEDPVFATVADVRDDARAMVQRGVKLAERGELDEAIALHEKALATDASVVQAHANLISLYGRQKNWAKAEEHYRATVLAGIELERAHYDYAVMLGMQGRVEEAGAAYRKALAINPLHAHAHNNLGEILERQRKLDGALEAYQHAVQAQPGFRLARLNVGRMLLALGRPDEALAQFEKIVEPRDAEAPRYLFALATAYVRSGRREEGIKWATDAKSLALQFGQNELAAAIGRELEKLK